MSINNNNHKLVKIIILLKTDHKTERNELTENKTYSNAKNYFE